jgi:hypothetical protein
MVIATLVIAPLVVLPLVIGHSSIGHRLFGVVLFNFWALTTSHGEGRAMTVVEEKRRCAFCQRQAHQDCHLCHRPICDFHKVIAVDLSFVPLCFRCALSRSSRQSPVAHRDEGGDDDGVDDRQRHS